MTGILTHIGTPGFWIGVSWYGLAVAAVISIAFAPIGIEIQAAVYLIGMVLLNLPHGAVENWLNLLGRLRGDIGRYLAAFALSIAAFMALYLTAPIAGVGLAVVIATLKVAGGELAVLRTVMGDGHLKTPWRRVLSGGVRGGAVMAVPIIAQPAMFESFAGPMVALVDPGALSVLATAFDDVRQPLVFIYSAAMVVHACLCGVVLWRGRDEAADAFYDLSETLALVAFFTWVPVLIAVGIFFPFWYSARQMARATTASDTSSSRACAHVHVSRRAAYGLVGLIGLTAALMMLLGSVLGTNPVPADRLLDGVAFWTMAIATVAFPHVLIGGYLDHRGIWTAGI